MAETDGVVTIKIFADGEDQGNIGVVSLYVYSEANKISYAEIVLDDGDPANQEFPTSNDPKYAPGATLAIELGRGTQTEPIFEGIVVKHRIKARRDGVPLLHLMVKHSAVQMTHYRKSRHFPEQTDAEIAEAILGEYEADFEVKGMELEHEKMVQYNVSDWDFLVARAEANGCVVVTEEGKITVAPPEVKEDSEMPTAAYGGNIMEFEAETDGRDLYVAGSAVGWNYTTQELDPANSEEPSDVPDATSPSSAEAASSLGDGEFQLRHSGELSDLELAAWTNNTFMRSRLGKVRGRIRLMGDRAFQTGKTLVIEGTSQVFNGAAYIGGVRHEVVNGIWTTTVQVGMDPRPHLVRHPNVVDAPAKGLLPPVRGLRIGKVTQLTEDPEGQFRVLVKMATVDDAEDGIWCRVARLDAGNSHTVFFQPQIDDEVVVGFLEEDPRHGIVLGSLHSSGDQEPPLDSNDEFLKRGIVTPEGLSVVLDDELKAVTIETPGGKKVALDEDAGTILLEDENGNKIEMSSDGIVMESGKDIVLKATGDVKIEGVNIENSAQAQFVAEGTAGAELKSSAVVAVEGSLITLN